MSQVSNVNSVSLIRIRWYIGAGIESDAFVDGIVYTIEQIRTAVGYNILGCLMDLHLVQQFGFLQLQTDVVPNVDGQVFCGTGLRDYGKIFLVR